jgi:hypothetical protein
MSEFSNVALFKTSKKLIINFFDVLIFATSKNFDVIFLTKALKRQKVAIFCSASMPKTWPPTHYYRTNSQVTGFTRSKPISSSQPVCFGPSK